MNLNQLSIYQNVQHTEVLHRRYPFYQTIGRAHTLYSLAFNKVIFKCVLKLY
jgi:hypothetical protein